MMTHIEVFWSEPPREKSETQFLNQFQADLKRSGISATILANYFTASRSRQIDFLVITEKHVCHVELKQYPPLLIGGTNGPWSTRRPDGTLEEIDRQNPYTQAFDCKMAISDDMRVIAQQDSTVPQPARGAEFYRQIDSVVCIFPRLDAGSQVPDDFKVRTLGYAEFVRFLTAPGKHPGWTADHWAALIRMLQLTSATESAQPMPQSVAQERVSGYVSSFKDFYSQGLHEWVELPLISNGARLPLAAFATVLQQQKHVQLVGPSGCGKSHLARHVLTDLPDGAVVPVLIEGNMYEGRLSSLLERSLAPFMADGAKELLLAAAINAQTVLLVVDGYNECPPSLQERLLRDLSSFCQRAKTLTLITSQAKISTPGPLSGTVVTVGDLSETDRKAVLSSYGAPEIDRFCEPFTTAYELSIAAECAGELHGTVTRAGLFSAFIRRRLRRANSPSHTRGALRQLALVMDDELRTSLPLDEAERTVERYLVDHSAPAGVLDEVFKASITASRQGRFSFSHELLGRFLATESLALRDREPADLVQVLRRPRHQDLTSFAVELETNAERAGALLEGLADWHLYAQALRGDSGSAAARASHATAHQLLQAVTQEMTNVTFTVGAEYAFAVTGGYELTAADRSLLTAIGALLREREYLPEVALLLDATDAACRRSADIQARSTGRRPTAAGMVATVLVGLGRDARSTVAAAILLEAMNLTRLDSLFRANRRKPPAGVHDISVILDAATPGSHGRLLLACALLQPLDGPEAATLALRLARLCWDSGAYHVQLEGLTMIRSFVAETHGQPLGDEIVDFLESLDVNNNIALSTLVVETLHSYGRVESPYDEEDVRAQISAILRGPINQEIAEQAYSIVSNQFEEVIGEPFFTAVQALSAHDKVRFYSIAALGAPSYGFWDDWLLRELLTAADPAALPAFQHWATHLDLDGFYGQGSTACYLLAVQGCALFTDEPPRAVGCRTSDQEAWQCYGAIIFWLYRPQMSDEEVAARCAPYWQQLAGPLLPAAADPLYQFLHANRAYDQDGKPVLARIILTFPNEARPILEWSLRHRDSLTSIFEGPERDDRASNIIDMLGIVGDLETIELLRDFTDDQVLGRDAIRAIRKLTSQCS
jgi:hypothetical protein